MNIPISGTDKADLLRAQAVINNLLAGKSTPADALAAVPDNGKCERRARKSKQNIKKEAMLALAEELGPNFLKFIRL